MAKTRKEYRISQRQSSGWTNPHLKLMKALDGEGIRYSSEYPIGVVDNDGKTWTLRVDLLISLDVKGAVGLVVEVHGERFHRSKRMVQKDAWKRELLEKDGYRCLSVWDYELKTKEDIAGIVKQIREAMKGGD